MQCREASHLVAHFNQPPLGTFLELEGFNYIDVSGIFEKVMMIECMKYIVLKPLARKSVQKYTYEE